MRRNATSTSSPLPQCLLAERSTTSRRVWIIYPSLKAWARLSSRVVQTLLSTTLPRVSITSTALREYWCWLQTTPVIIIYTTPATSLASTQRRLRPPLTRVRPKVAPLPRRRPPLASHLARLIPPLAASSTVAAFRLAPRQRPTTVWQTAHTRLT